MIDFSEKFYEIQARHADKDRIACMDAVTADVAREIWGIDPFPNEMINKYGVFLQYYRVKEVILNPKTKIEIKLVTANGLWAFGYNFHAGTSGSSAGPSIGSKVAFESEVEAIENATNMAIKFMEREKSRGANIADRDIAALSAPTQLELF